MRTFLANVPLFLPGVILSLVIAFVLARPVARFSRTTRSVAFLGLISIGVIISATLTPGVEAIAQGISSDGGCDVSRVGLIPLSELTGINDASLNVLLFIPLGIAIGLLPWSRRFVAILTAALLMPFVIEVMQALVPAFGRGCSSADVANNLTGLVIGLAAGGLARRASATR